MPIPTSIDELSITAANNFPVGTETVFPNLDNYLRTYAAFIAQLRDRLDAEGLPLCSVTWWGGARTAIQARFAALDGQLLLRADYPALWSFLSAGKYPMTTDAVWLSNPLQRASFSSGNGSTTFRLPDLNGKQASTIGAVTLRGDGAASAGSAGQMQDSQNLTHGHGVAMSGAGDHSHYFSGSTSASGNHTHGVPDSDSHDGSGVSFDSGRYPGNYNIQTSAAGNHSHWFEGGTAGGGWHVHDVWAGESGGNEARMKSATGAWLMRVK